MNTKRLSTRAVSTGTRQRRRGVQNADVNKIVSALDYMRIARGMLRDADAHHAAGYVARAIKSADGARRHAEGVLARQERAAEGCR